MLSFYLFGPELHSSIFFCHLKCFPYSEYINLFPNPLFFNVFATLQQTNYLSNINIIFPSRIEAVYGQFKLLTHLNFINKYIVFFLFIISIFNVIIKCMIFFKFFNLKIRKVYRNNIGFWVRLFNFMTVSICLDQKIMKT